MDISFLYDYLYNKIQLENFNEDDVKHYVQDVVSFLELNEYLADVWFSPERYRDLGSYNFKDRKVRVALKAIINEARMVLNMMDDKPNQQLMINLFILKTLLHEITHIYHNYLVSECDNDISKVFYVELDYFHQDTDLVSEQYVTHYNKLIFERDANISSVENILRIISKYLHDDLVFAYYYEELKRYLLAGYEERNGRIISPIEVVYQDLLKQDIIYASNIDLYDRLKLGFQVTSEEMNEFKGNIDSIILFKNNLHRM